MSILTIAMSRRILIAEDNDISMVMLSSVLETWGYSVIKARNGLQALEVLEGQNPPDICILDVVMPGMLGTDVCRKVKACSKGMCKPYVIMLTSQNSSKDIDEGFNAGADDYVVKPYDPGELKARVGIAVACTDLVARCKAA